MCQVKAISFHAYMHGNCLIGRKGKTGFYYSTEKVCLLLFVAFSLARVECCLMHKSQTSTYKADCMFSGRPSFMSLIAIIK